MMYACAWPLLLLLVLLQSRTAQGQTFFMDGAPGCSSNGYGISIYELSIDCQMDNEDGACYFDELVNITGTVTTQAQIPKYMKVVPRLCRRSGRNCSAPLIQYTYINACDYLESEDGEECQYASTSTFSAEMYVPNNDFIQELYEWALEKNENLYENEQEWYGYNGQEEEFQCDEEDDQYDCEQLQEEYEAQQQANEEIYGYGTVGTVSAKFQLRVTFEPVQDLSIFSEMYANDYEATYYRTNKKAYTDDQIQGQENWNQMINAYMIEPSKSIYCNIPFRLVADEYNVTSYKERNVYYKSWWYRFFSGMLSDCELTWSCEKDDENDQETGKTYYYAGSVGIVGLLGGVYGIVKRRRTVTEGEQRLVEDDEEKTIEVSNTSKSRQKQIDGDSYVTMS